MVVLSHWIHLWEPFRVWFDQNPVIGFFFCVTLLDMVTGVLRALRDRALNSRVSRDGMFRKAGMILMLCVAVLFERFSGMPLVTIVAAALAYPECISIVENLALLGVPIHPALLQFFETYGKTYGPARKDKAFDRLDGSPTITDPVSVIVASAPAGVVTESAAVAPPATAPGVSPPAVIVPLADPVALVPPAAPVDPPPVPPTP